jgi:hypothetical protein
MGTVITLVALCFVVRAVFSCNFRRRIARFIWFSSASNRRTYRSVRMANADDRRSEARKVWYED